MKKGFMKQINSLVSESNVILEVLDARFPERTRNRDIERSILAKKKKLVVVMNKADLVEKEKLVKAKKDLISGMKVRVVFVSAKDRVGIRLLKREISIATGKKGGIIGILGYPNSGKSTLINSLSGKGKGKVRTSRKAGFTRGLQKIKISEGLYLVDAPGIIPYGERDEFELFLVGAKNANKLKDFETVAMKLVFELKEKIQKKFNLEIDDEEELVRAIAKKKNWLVSGGKGDIHKAAREILEMYQRNEI